MPGLENQRRKKVSFNRLVRRPSPNGLALRFAERDQPNGSIDSVRTFPWSSQSKCEHRILKNSRPFSINFNWAPDELSGVKRRVLLDTGERPVHTPPGGMTAGRLTVFG